MIISYLNSATVSMYRTWYRDGKKVPIEEVIDLASNLIENGVKDNIKLHQS